METAARDRATALSRHNTLKALAAARRIRDPWSRAQALACVARFAPDTQVEAIATEALAACRAGADAYQRVAAVAWPLRALVERERAPRARRELSRILELAPGVTPPASRSEALFLLFQATFALGPATRERMVRDLVAAERVASHWRACRAVVDAITVLNHADPAEAARVAGSLPDGPAQRKALSALAAGRTLPPRAFFW